jgi:hypothetical protein
MKSIQPTISTNRRVALLVVNTFGLFLLFPALGFIAFLNRRGIAQIFGVCEIGLLIANVFAWPRIMAGTRGRAMVIAACASYLPATVGWAVAVRGAFFKGMPSAHQFGSLAMSAAVVGGLFTILYWLTLSIGNFIVLRRPVRPVEQGVGSDRQSA